MKLVDANAKPLALFKADKFIRRLMGLFSTKAQQFDGIVISPCQSVHTFFMKKSIDVIYLTESGVVLKVIKEMTPNRISWCLGASSVIEVFSDRQIKEYKMGEYLDV